MEEIKIYEGEYAKIKLYSKSNQLMMDIMYPLNKTDFIMKSVVIEDIVIDNKNDIASDENKVLIRFIKNHYIETKIDEFLPSLILNNDDVLDLYKTIALILIIYKYNNKKYI